MEKVYSGEMAVKCVLYVKILFTSNTVVYIQAFIAIEKGFFELINDSLAEKYNLMMQIPAVC